MARPASELEEVGREVHREARRAAAHPGAHLLARAGILSKSVVYAVLGGLALLAAAGRGGRATDSRGAIETIATQPYGRALVAVLAVGFLALGAWFIVEPIANREGRPRNWWGAVERVGQACGGLMYLGLALWTARLALGGSGGPSSSTLTRSYTARALELPAGRALVLAAGVIALVVGIHQVRNGWQLLRHAASKLKLEAMPRWLRSSSPWIAFAGYAAQGTVVVLIGAFLLQAAREANPREAAGFDGALARIAQQSYGMALLAVVALGLISYAVTAAVEARCRRL